MSSRLLTMKFMQRAAASAPTSPSTPDQKFAKRQKLADGSYQSPSPRTPDTNDAVVKKALADEEAKRQSAIDREAAFRGESKWYLDVQPSAPRATPSGVRIISAGFSALDANGDHDGDNDDDDSESQTVQIGRRSFGKPLPQPEETAEKKEHDSSDSESEEDSKEPPDRSEQGGTGNALRAQLKAKRKVNDAKNAQLAEERRSKQVNLNKLTSISGGGRAAPSVTCHACGKQGHIKAQCTNVKRHSRKTL